MKAGLYAEFCAKEIDKIERSSMTYIMVDEDAQNVIG